MLYCFGLILKSCDNCGRFWKTEPASCPRITPSSYLKTHSAKLTQLGIEILPHPPYSPDLSSTGYHCFQALHTNLRQHQFPDVEHVEIVSGKLLKSCDLGLRSKATKSSQHRSEVVNLIELFRRIELCFSWVIATWTGLPFSAINFALPWYHEHTEYNSRTTALSFKHTMIGCWSTSLFKHSSLITYFRFFFASLMSFSMIQIMRAVCRISACPTRTDLHFDTRLTKILLERATN